MRHLLGLVMVVGVLGLWVWQNQSKYAFDGYYVLAVSWTPSWCAQEGDARGDARCADGSGAGWLVHGLWPQYASGGWPEYCKTFQSEPDQADLAAMLPVMGSEGLARHQWNKHGTCSGLSAPSYFAMTRAAFERLDLPDPQAEFARGQAAPAQLLDAVLARNPGMGRDMAVVTCRAGDVQEIRVCMDTDLQPRACDSELLSRVCQRRSVTIPATR